MWKGFKFALGACVAVVLVFSILQFGGAYGNCAELIDGGGVPSTDFCRWVASVHRP